MTLEQSHAIGLLEPRNLATQDRLCDANLIRNAGQAPVLGHAKKIAPVPNIFHREFLPSYIKVIKAEFRILSF
jgi:hypothetical protein